MVLTSLSTHSNGFFPMLQLSDTKKMVFVVDVTRAL